jgi:anti-anti-sigma factor
VRLGPDGAVVEVHGALGAHEARDLKRIVGATLAEGVPGMTIDLGAAGRIAPAGLAALVDLSQRANGTLRLARLKPEVRLLLEQAGLHVIVEIVE